jgi:hypothetical protein
VKQIILTLKVFFLVLILPLLVFGAVAARFVLIRYIPHERASIILPFSPEDDDLIFINPMGEKVEHPDSPLGHPGLDFGWSHPAPLIASMDGKVSRIVEHATGGHGETEKIYDVEVVSGVYAVRYEEISPASELKVGMQVKQGDVIGRGGKYNQPGALGVYYSTHWEFDFNTPIYDRLCPMTYFTPESRKRIEAIWAKVGMTYDGRYSEVCSGDYAGRQEK